MGFTLIELLVCIAIIAILTALLLPALKSARERGNRSNCAGNLKNFGYAFATYTSTWDDMFPPYTIYESNNKANNPGDVSMAKINGKDAKYAWSWGYELWKERLVTRSSFNCQTLLSMVDKTSGETSSSIHSLDTTAASFVHISYGYNARFFGVISSRVNGASWGKPRPVKASEIRNSSAMVLTDIATYKNGLLSDQSEYTFLDQTNTANNTYAHQRHSNTGNTLRADGSADNVVQSEFTLHRGHNPDAVKLLNWYKTK